MVTATEQRRPLVSGAPPSTPAVPDFQIVPLRLLPLAGLALVALVVGIQLDELWAMELLHVGAGALWTAVDLFMGFVHVAAAVYMAHGGPEWLRTLV